MYTLNEIPFSCFFIFNLGTNITIVIEGTQEPKQDRLSKKMKECNIFYSEISFSTGSRSSTTKSLWVALFRVTSTQFLPVSASTVFSFIFCFV